jgi:hypothetical protein
MTVSSFTKRRVLNRLRDIWPYVDEPAIEHFLSAAEVYVAFDSDSTFTYERAGERIRVPYHFTEGLLEQGDDFYEHAARALKLI